MAYQSNYCPIIINLNNINKCNNSYIDNFLNNILQNLNHNLSIIYSPFMNSLQNCKIYETDEIGKKQLNHPNNINILNLNCRSLFKKLDEIECFINLTNIDFDLISFIETWLKSHNENFAS